MRRLKIIFVILLLVTTGEIGYYIYFIQNQSRINLSQQKSINTNITGSSISPTVLLPTPKNVRKAIHPEFLELLKQEVISVDSNTQRVLFITENQGEVVEIDPTGEKGPNKSVFPFGIKLKTEKSQTGGWMYLSKNSLEKTKVYKAKGNQEFPAELRDLKIGNVIINQDISDAAFSPTDPQHIVGNVIKIIQ